MALVAGFGVLTGVVALALTRVMPADLGWTVFFGYLSIHLGFAAVVTWRRTRLALISTAMAFGSLFSLGVVALAGVGLGWPDLIRNQGVIVVPAVLVGPALFVIESRVHRTEWRRWRAYMHGCSLLDLLALRHIPDWRGASGR